MRRLATNAATKNLNTRDRLGIATTARQEEKPEARGARGVFRWRWDFG